jgi:methylated-DNA-protein-cysteine methyltransferase-like protein
MPDSSIARDDLARLAAQVYALVRACPPGRVTTYGWLAAAVGLTKGARLVGWIMNETPKGASVPAQRVVNAKGELSGSWAFGQRGRMRSLLEAEGVAFDDAGRINMKRFGWDPSRDLDTAERERVLAEADPSEAAPSDRLAALVRDDPASPFRLTRDGE